MKISGIGQLIERDDRDVLGCAPVEDEIRANETRAACDKNGMRSIRSQGRNDSHPNKFPKMRSLAFQLQL